MGKRRPFSDDLYLGIGVGIGIGIGIDGMYDSAWNIHVQNVLIRPPTSGLSHEPWACANWPQVGHVPDFPVCIAFIAAGCRGRRTGLEGSRGAGY
ncbi:MAG TPA: hypothetical protein DEW46_16740 [Verrucomicrobia bacterium]|nr:hypothetical protein [Verrucomicrobiota bacterium]